MTADGGPDWGPIIAGVGAVLTAAGGIYVTRAASSRTKVSDAEQRQDKRDTAATANASLTLESVFRLVNELQEEVARKSAEIERVERICMETKSTLLTRIGELEAETRRLEKEVRELKSTRD